MPALQIIWKRRRHFELFVGCFQLVCAVAYSSSNALGTSILLKQDEWHMMSDILTETYVCLLCVHLMGLRSEDNMHCLRYISFMFCWIFKQADGWSSVLYEVLLLLAFVSPPTVLITQDLLTGPLLPIFPGEAPEWLRYFLDRKLAFNKDIAPQALACVSAGLLFLCIELVADTELRLFNSFAHCAFGGGAYCMWRFLPCYDKSDELPLFK